jgi:hypothetical protein
LWPIYILPGTPLYRFCAESVTYKYVLEFTLKKKPANTLSLSCYGPKLLLLREGILPIFALFLQNGLHVKIVCANVLPHIIALIRNWKEANVTAVTHALEFRHVISDFGMSRAPNSLEQYILALRASIIVEIFKTLFPLSSGTT